MEWGKFVLTCLRSCTTKCNKCSFLIITLLNNYPMSPSSSSVRTTISSRTWCPLWTVTFGKSGLPGTALESFPPWTRSPRARPPWTRSTVMGNILLMKSWPWRSLESRLLRAIHWWRIPTLFRETLFVRIWRKSSGSHYDVS